MTNKVNLILIALLLSFTYGCMTPYKTQTARSGVEELLISTAADRSIESLDSKALASKKLFLDAKNLEAIDKGYVVAKARQVLISNGSIVVEDPTKADVIVEIYSGALATDGDDMLIGIPSIPVPIPGAGGVLTPEIPFIKKVTQLGVSKLAFHGKDKEGNYVFASKSLSGTSYYNRWQILFFSFSTTDIPEKK
jgi:hypothetical protein